MCPEKSHRPKAPFLVEILKQPQYHPMPAQNEIMILFAGAHGYLDEWPVEAMSEYERQMLEFMESKHGGLLSEINEKGDIPEALEEGLKKALDEFKAIFQTGASA